MTRILVLGGTGMLGAPVARRLQADGFAVRLLARDPEKARALLGDGYEIVAGDATDGDRVQEALHGCQGAHISVGGAAEQPAAAHVAAAAPALGVERVTYVSGATVAEQNRWFPMAAQKLDAEAALRASGVPYTIFCPTWPMEQLPRLAMGGRPLLIGDRPVTWHWYAADDMARMVANAYERDETANKRLFVHGPEPMTMAEAMARYCQTFHPEVETVQVMPVAAAQAMAASTGNNMLAFFADLMSYFDKVGEMGDPDEADRLLGAPATTLDDWIAVRSVVMA